MPFTRTRSALIVDPGLLNQVTMQILYLDLSEQIRKATHPALREGALEHNLLESLMSGGRHQSQIGYARTATIDVGMTLGAVATVEHLPPLNRLLIPPAGHHRLRQRALVARKFGPQRHLATPPV